MSTKKTFRQWIKSLPVGTYTETLEHIRQRAKISKIVWYNYRVGKTSVPPLVQDIINDVAGEELNYEREPSTIREGSEL